MAGLFVALAVATTAVAAPGAREAPTHSRAEFEPRVPSASDYARWRARGALTALQFATHSDVHAAAVSSLGSFLESRDAHLQPLDDLEPVDANMAIVAPRLIELLRQGSSRTSEATAFVIAAFGRHAELFIPPLIAMLDADDLDTRWGAANAIGLLGTQARAAVPRLIGLLTDASPETRYAVMWALGKLGEPAAPAAPTLIDLLGSSSSKIQYAATRALGQLGTQATPAVPKLIELLASASSETQYAAAEALGALHGNAKPAVPNLVELLSTGTTNARWAAAEALGKIGPDAIAAVPRLLELLRSGQSSVRRDAAVALGRLGEHAQQGVPLLIELLSQSDEPTRAAAADALGRMGQHAVVAVPTLVDLLSQRDRATRVAAAQAIARLGEHAAAAIPRLIELINGAPSASDRDPSPLDKLPNGVAGTDRQLEELLNDAARETRLSAFDALRALRGHARSGLPTFLSLLNDGDELIRQAAEDAIGGLREDALSAVPELMARAGDARAATRISALRALEKLGGHARAALPELLRLLGDDEPAVRVAAIQALGALGEHAGPHALAVARALYDLSNPGSALESLQSLGPTPRDQALRTCGWILSIATRHASLRGRAVYLAYLHGSADSQLSLAVHWLESADDSSHPASAAEALDALGALDRLRSAVEDRTLGALIKTRVEGILNDGEEKSWWSRPSAPTLAVLHRLSDTLKYQSDQSALLEQKIARLEQLGTWQAHERRFGLFALAHLSLWLLLWFGYPRSEMIRAVFFWNKWIRRFVGFGYVGFLLTWVPALRRRLLEPFHWSLVAEAKLDQFEPNEYFKHTLVYSPHGGPSGITHLLAPKLDGKNLLIGESGLGKTQFARYLLMLGWRSGYPAVFLPARSCASGVMEAIQSKLLGYARDREFLQNIMYSGGLDVYIDGLNDVVPETRRLIAEFAADPGVRNLLLITQPMDWQPPGVLREFRILPLTRRQIVEFAKSRWHSLSKRSRIDRIEFETRCEALVSASARPSCCGDPEPGWAAMADEPDLDEWTLKVLSNPMDLNTATELIARRVEPNLRALYTQQFRLMEQDYRDMHLCDFPLEKLAGCAFEMRLNDVKSLQAEQIGAAALSCLEAHHLALRRFEVTDPGRQASLNNPSWVFRHDKVFDFFIARAFRGNEERQWTYKADPRFRGVYLMLALEESLEVARELERILIDYAAETKDHSLSDDFINLLNARRTHGAAAAGDAHRADAPAPLLLT